MGVHIDETRRHEQIGGVDHTSGCSDIATDLGDDALIDGDVGACALASGPIDDETSEHHEIVHGRILIVAESALGRPVGSALCSSDGE